MGSCAGVDWASEKHDVVVQNEAGDELYAGAFAHDEAGLRSLCGALLRLGVGLVAIERPEGVLVERLLDVGLRVLALHPNQVAATRARFRAAGGKSDRFDAFVLCELARTDQHRFRVLEPDSDRTKALRALSRSREDLVRARVALANQLRAELERFWPGPIGLFAQLHSPVSLAFIERYPSPQDARGLGERRLAAFLARQHYPGGKQPAELLARLRSAPEGRAGEQESRARRTVVLALVRALLALVAEIKQLEREIALALGEHPDGQIFRSLFRGPDSVICAATMLSEVGDCRARYPTRDTFAGDAGQAAVAIESGKRKVASFRWACNKRLRNAFRTLAESSRQWHPWAADQYAAARARGHNHSRAIRTVGRAWSRVVWRCWQDRVPYDPARHRALQQHCQVITPTTSGPRPDLPATQRMLGAAVTNGGPQGPSAKRLTASRQPLPTNKP